jgi:hypothetical protein
MRGEGEAVRRTTAAARAQQRLPLSPATLAERDRPRILCAMVPVIKRTAPPEASVNPTDLTLFILVLASAFTRGHRVMLLSCPRT